MSIREYFKHRWYMFVMIFIAGIFSYLVSWASDLLLNTDFLYIAAGIAIVLFVFIIIDYIKMQNRLKTMEEFLENSCSAEFSGNYPLDYKYAGNFKEIVDDYNKYKEDTETEHSSELEFITKWVHDVKVPIAAIKLITEKMDTAETQHIEMQLNYIDQNIQKILYHMKSKTFYDDYKIREVSIKSIVNQALKDYAVFFAYKSISLNIDCEDYKVYTDDKWSIYMVSQLISNAIKYTDTNGKIVISAKKEKNRVALSVKNTGIGIEKQNLDIIFRRGYSNFNTRKEKSTGYGLYLAKKLADKMGHEIKVQSKPGEYAEFSIYYKTNADSIYYNNVSLD